MGTWQLVSKLNLYLGRRRNFLKCFLFKREDKDKDLEELLHKKQYSFYFTARYANEIYGNKEIYGNVFSINSEEVDLISYDDLKEVKSNDIVYFNGTFWIINNISQKIRIKESEFLKNPSSFYFLSVRRK